MSNTTSYGLLCGMEVHAELKTASKMFCGCKNDPFHAEQPNTHTCPVCLGMPGGLPVPNKKAIEWTIQLGLALGCEINLFSKFDRKHYFYPDLPKGYQISQYDLPFCYNGVVETSFGPVRIRRIHLEEDTGKLLHKEVDGKNVTLVDFNRSSVPLIEIVSEADIRSSEQAMEYAQKLREIIRYLDIGDCDMEKGGMRVEANLSLAALENGQQTVPLDLPEREYPDYKVELKNINSFRFMAAAVEYEMERQRELLEAGTTPAQETRGWDSVKQVSFSQRSKETAEDYRYFPDPDIPPIRFTEKQVQELRQALPELPAEVQKRWQAAYAIDEQYLPVLLETQQTVAWVDAVGNLCHTEKQPADKVIAAVINKRIDHQVGDAPEAVVAAYKKLFAHEDVDSSELTTVIEQVMQENQDAVERYKAGQKQVVGFFIGQVMKQLGKKVDPQQVKSAVGAALEK